MINVNLMEEIRERCRKLILNKVLTCLEAKPIEIDRSCHKKCYTNIELAEILSVELDKGVINYMIHQGEKCFNEKMYKSRLRQLLWNLIPNKCLNNPHLLTKVLSKEITIPHLCVYMSAEDMFPEHYIEVREEIHAEMQKKYNLTDISELPDGAVKCRKCKSWKTSYNSLQTRSSDEPETKFAYCHKCGFRWKFY